MQSKPPLRAALIPNCPSSKTRQSSALSSSFLAASRKVSGFGLAQSLGRESVLGQQFEGDRIDLAGWMTAGGESAKAAGTVMVENGFGHDGAGGIAGAEEQYVVRAIRHDVVL